MARKYEDVAHQIIGATPEAKKAELRDKISHMEKEVCRNSLWSAPELITRNLFLGLSKIVNEEFEASSADKTSVTVYTILCDCSEAEMIERFKADGR